MTITTAMEGITAPRHPADPHATHDAAPTARIIDADTPPTDFDTGDPVEDFAAQAWRGGPKFTPSRRHNGWTPDRQRAFLEYLAQGLTVSDAATLVGLSAASAYAFRARAAGAAFAVGWQGALLLQRNRLVDELTSRAFRGQTETIIRPDGARHERHRYDNGLALRLLARLDKVAAAELPDRTGDARAARLAAQDWDRYLDLIGGDASPARAGLFLSLRSTEGEADAIAPIVALARADLYQRTGAGHSGEVDAHDLDPAQRHAWSAADWARAEAAGLVALAAPLPPPEREPAPGSQLSQRSIDAIAAERAAEPVWWDDDAEEWRTRFPPPEDFIGEEDGRYGDFLYERTLTDDEVAAWEAAECRDTARRLPIETAERDAFFAARMGDDDRDGDAADARDVAAVAAGDDGPDDDTAAAPPGADPVGGADAAHARAAWNTDRAETLKPDEISSKVRMLT